MTVLYTPKTSRGYWIWLWSLRIKWFFGGIGIAVIVGAVIGSELQKKSMLKDQAGMIQRSNNLSAENGRLIGEVTALKNGVWTDGKGIFFSGKQNGAWFVTPKKEDPSKGGVPKRGLIKGGTGTER
jgi:hypothetical protein